MGMCIKGSMRMGCLRVMGIIFGQINPTTRGSLNKESDLGQGYGKRTKTRTPNVTMEATLTTINKATVSILGLMAGNIKGSSNEIREMAMGRCTETRCLSTKGNGSMAGRSKTTKPETTV